MESFVFERQDIWGTVSVTWASATSSSPKLSQTCAELLPITRGHKKSSVMSFFPKQLDIGTAWSQEGEEGCSKGLVLAGCVPPILQRKRHAR